LFNTALIRIKLNTTYTNIPNFGIIMERQSRVLLPPLEKETVALVELGLTMSEARVYLALAQIGTSKIGHISKTTGICREHLYQTMHSLEDKGLVEKELGVISQYKAVPPSEALSMLVKVKQKQFAELKIKAKIITENLGKFSMQPETIGELQEENAQFIIIPGKEIIIPKIKEALKRVQTSLEVVTIPKRFSSAILEFVELYKKALKRGVTIRIATEKHTPEKAALEAVLALTENPRFEVKCFPYSPQAVVVIFDKKEAFVTMSATANFAGTSCLWSKNTCFIALAQNYFENIWSNTHEELRIPIKIKTPAKPNTPPDTRIEELNKIGV
jgi:sugar-specific transcriptional regulator TrmB